MAYRFRPNEPVDKEVRRIALEQIERALGEMAAATANPDVAVHETRKAMKRLRALLRLVRPALGEEGFHRDNAECRDLSQLLSSARDAFVLRQTVDKLIAETEATGPERTALTALEKNLTSTTDAADDTPPFAEAATRLHRLARRVRRYKFDGDGFDIIGRGLQRCYRSACRKFKAAYTEPTDEAFHEWRKTVQQHWRHMALLTRVWPQELDARVALSRQLSQILGDDHDLAVLAAFIPDVLPADAAAPALAAARRRQQALRDTANPLGQLLFAETASALHERMASYWAAAHMRQGPADAALADAEE